MDQEIEQLLHSLNVTTSSVEQSAQPASAIPLEQYEQPVVPEAPPSPEEQSASVALPEQKKRSSSSFVAWIKKHEPWILWVGGVLLLVKASILAFFLIHGVPESWISRERRIFRTQEAPEIEQMAPLPHPTMGRTVWSPDEAFPHELPEGLLSNTSLFKDHLDILQAASGRRKALEEIRHDVDSLMATCIHAPDRSTSEALRRAFVRFDLTDLDLTHSVISMILSKKPFLKTPSDVQRLDETLSLAGLGRGLKEYSAVSAQLASTKKAIGELLSKLESDRSVVRLASNLEAALRLLDGLHKNQTIASSVDVQSYRRAAMDRCRNSVRQLIAQSEQQIRRPSPEERLAVAYLQRTFPDISVDMWARLDNSLVPLVSSKLAVHEENSMGNGELFAESARIMLPPDASFPVDEPLSVAERVQ